MRSVVEILCIFISRNYKKEEIEIFTRPIEKLKVSFSFMLQKTTLDKWIAIEVAGWLLRIWIY